MTSVWGSLLLLPDTPDGVGSTTFCLLPCPAVAVSHISQSDKAEPTSGNGQLSTEQKQNISRKICLLHELFRPVHPVCAVSVRLQWGLRVMAERMIKCLPREASSPMVPQLQAPFRTTTVQEKARADFGETVGSVLDTVSAFSLIPAPVRAVIQAVRSSVVSVARAVWDFFF